MHGYGMQMGLTDTETTLTTKKNALDRTRAFFESTNKIKAEFVLTRPISRLIEAKINKQEIRHKTTKVQAPIC